MLRKAAVPTAIAAAATTVVSNSMPSPVRSPTLENDAFSPTPNGNYLKTIAIPELPHHMLHSSLAGNEKLEKYTLHISDDAKYLEAFARLGSKVCGHPNIIHGGAIASLLDDAMGVLFLSSQEGSGFTANLNINYRRPIVAGSDVVIVCEIEKVEVSQRSGSKKVFLKGTVYDDKTYVEYRRLINAGASESVALESVKPIVYTEGNALFIVKDIPGGAYMEKNAKPDVDTKELA